MDNPDDIIRQTIEQKERPRSLCLVLLKPSGMLIQDEIIEMLQGHANIVLDQHVFTSPEKVAQHYDSVKYDRSGQESYFYPALVRYMSNRTLRALVIEAKTDMLPAEFVKYIKEEVVGNNNHGIPQSARPDQIRYLGVVHSFEHDQYVDMSDMYDQLPESWRTHPRRETIIDNLIHSSANPSEAIEEIRIWFGEATLLELMSSNGNSNFSPIES